MNKASYTFGGLVGVATIVSVLALVQAYQPVPIPDQLPSFVDAGPPGKVVKDAGVIILPEMTIVADKPTVKTAPASDQNRVVGGVLDLHTIPNYPFRQHDPSNNR